MGYTVGRGDSLASIAARTGVSLDALRKANPQVQSVQVGQTLNIPGRKDSFETGPGGRAAPAFTSPVRDAAGAYYRKVISGSSTTLSGISTTGVLPTPTFDPKRGPSKDVPDVYVGAHNAKGEIDCGLAWNRIRNASDREAFTDLPGGCDGGDLSHRLFNVNGSWVDGNGKSVPATDPRLAKAPQPDYAYHPYVRDTSHPGNGGYLDSPADQRLTYLYPGRPFSLSLQVKPDGSAQMKIGGSTTPFHQEWSSPRFANATRQFKRCIAIDQSGAEKAGQVDKTASTLSHGGWNSVLLDKTDGPPQPMTVGHGTLRAGSDTLPRYGSIYHVTGSNDQGGEWLNITPAG